MRIKGGAGAARRRNVSFSGLPLPHRVNGASRVIRAYGHLCGLLNLALPCNGVAEKNADFNETTNGRSRQAKSEACGKSSFLTIAFNLIVAQRQENSRRAAPNFFKRTRPPLSCPLASGLLPCLGRLGAGLTRPNHRSPLNYPQKETCDKGSIISPARKN